MSAKTLASVAKSARDTLIDVAWRQWAAIGAPASNVEPARSVVDPEALVLISLLLKDDEHRMWDVLTGWAEYWSRLLSVQRTRNLLRGYAKDARTAVQEFAHFASVDAADARWRNLARRSASRRPRKHLEERPHLSKDAAMLLRLRLGFGVGMRADVLGFLLTAPVRPTDVQHVATALDYTGPATRRVLDDLAAARLVTVSTLERPAMYGLNAKSWKTLLQQAHSMPVWRYWQQIFSFLMDVITWERSSSGRDLSAFAMEALGWELLEKHRAVFVWNGRALQLESQTRSSFADTTLGLCDWVKQHA